MARREKPPPLFTRVALAARAGDRAALEALRAEHPHRFDAYAGDAFELAVLAGHEDLAEVLLSWGVDIDAAPHASAPPLVRAVERRNEAAVRWLLAHGAAIEPAADSPLHAAVRIGDAAMVRLLLDHGASVTRELGRPPRNALACAGATGEIADLLRERGAVATQLPEPVRVRVERPDGRPLSEDAEVLRTFLAETRARNPAATGIYVFFALQNGLVRVTLSTEVPFRPIERGVSHADAELELPHWQRRWALVAPGAEPALRRAVGETILRVLRDVGAGCELWVQDDEDLCWPDPA